jgi:DNA-binding CsgD family transcriptional regulator
MRIEGYYQKDIAATLKIPVSRVESICKRLNIKKGFMFKYEIQNEIKHHEAEIRRLKHQLKRLENASKISKAELKNFKKEKAYKVFTDNKDNIQEMMNQGITCKQIAINLNMNYGSLYRLVRLFDMRRLAPSLNTSISEPVANNNLK